MKIKELLENNQYDIHDLSDIRNGSGLSIEGTIGGIAKYIKQNCSEMLQAYEYAGCYLYRGMSSTANRVATKIRPDRKPVEMPKLAHEMLHTAFIKLGLKATRTNSIFCTTKISVATTWGSPYLIFVKDGWHGTVFENIKNHYAFVKLRNFYYAKEAQSVDELVELIKNEKPYGFSTAEDLQEILAQQYQDVLLTGDSYIGLNLNNQNAAFIAKLLYELDLQLDRNLASYLGLSD